jgi:hypothetical protein
MSECLVILEAAEAEDEAKTAAAAKAARPDDWLAGKGDGKATAAAADILARRGRKP